MSLFAKNTNTGDVCRRANGCAVTTEGCAGEETNNTLDKTIQYAYNGIGNIESVTTTAANGSVSTKSFAYDNTDRLTAYNGSTISYDALGRPTKYGAYTYSWNRDKLSSIQRGYLSQPGALYEKCSFTYNGYGQRIAKNYVYDNNPGSTSDYSYNYRTTYTYDHSGRLIRELITETMTYTGGSTRTKELLYLYDESGVIGCVFTVNGTSATYYYQRNLLGDVVGIYNTSGTKVVGYAYDAWGNCTITYGSNNEISRTNPIRYRGYYFDRETNLYYLNSRYYNPQWCRFISPDDTAYLDPESVNGLNLYCYCNNDPVNYCDPSGHGAEWWWNALKIVGAISIVATLTIAATIVTGGTATVVLAGAAMGSTAGLIGGGISGGISSVISGGNFIDGFAHGAFNGSITGGISGAFAASSVGIWGQVGINMLISGTNYTITNYNNFNLLDFGINMFIGGLAGFVGGDGWMKAGGTFTYDLALNGVKGSFIRIGSGYLREFADPIIKSTIVGSSTFVTEIIRLMR